MREPPLHAPLLEVLALGPPLQESVPGPPLALVLGSPLLDAEPQLLDPEPPLLLAPLPREPPLLGAGGGCTAMSASAGASTA